MSNQPTDGQITQLHSAMLDAFNFNDLKMMVAMQLGANLEQLVSVQGRTTTDMIYDLIRVYAAREGGFQQLMDAVSEYVPENDQLTASVDELSAFEFDPLPPPDTTIALQNALESVALRQKQDEIDKLINGDFDHLPFEPETVLIPAGSFLMGSELSETTPTSEMPAYKVDLPNYRIGKYPVTNQEYAHFLQASGLIAPPELGWDGQRPSIAQRNYPIAGVTFVEAQAYCCWLCQETGRAYQLPTEAHWEKAARTEDGRVYPWGNEWNEGRCNHGGGAITVVDAFMAQNKYGCHDMVGNVREWTCTLWGERLHEPDPRYAYPWQDDERNDVAANEQIRRVWRGGGYADKQAILCCAARGRQLPASRGVPHKRYGFRVLLLF